LRTLGHDELTATANRRQTEAPKLIHLVRGDMDWIVMKCLAKERTRRYETANGLARDIERHLCHEPVSAFPPSRLYELRKTVRRHWVGFGATTAVLVALTVGTVVSTLGLGRARRAEREQSQWRQEAQTAAAAAKRTLALSDLSEAVRLSEAHEGGAALAYLGRVLSAEPTNSAALTRAATLLMYRSWMVPTIIVPQGNWVSAEFSPDGTRFLTASWDNTARVWDSQTGAPVTPVLAPREAPRPTGLAARFSPDGARVLTGSGDGTARVWDARTGAPLTPWMDHGCLVGSVAFSPNGTRIATGDLYGYVRVWNAQTGAVELGPLLNGTYTCWVEFSPDGQWIATGCRPGVARVWNALTGKERCPPMKHRASVLSARFSPDGKWLVTASRDGTARVWDAESGQPLTDPLQHDDQVWTAVFSPDGKRILTISRDQTARVWDASTGQPFTKPLPHRGAVGYGEFSTDGRRIVTAATDHFARLWDALTGQPFAEPLYHAGTVGSARFSPNGRRILTGGQDGKARIWEPLGRPALCEPMRHRKAVVSCQVSPDGGRFVTASDDFTARVWDASSCTPATPALVHRDEINGAEFSPDAKRILTASKDHTAQVWDASNGQRLGGAFEHGGPVNVAHFAPDGARIVTASEDGKARLWEAQSGRWLAELPHRDSVIDAVFSPDGAWVATASRDGTARVWDGRTGAPRSGSLEQGQPLVCVRFSPDGKQLVTGAEWGGARIWDARSGRSLAVLSHLNRVVSAEFSPDSQLVLTACWDGAARVWDAQTGLLRHEPLQHANPLSWAHFSPNGRQVLTGSERDARLWDTQTGQPVSEPFGKSAPIQAAQFSPDGQRVLCGSIDGTAKVWDLAPTPAQCPDWLLPLMEAVSGQVLNAQGFLEETRLDRVSTINETRRRLAATAGNDPWLVFGRWLLADPATRTISPFGQITMREFVARRLEDGSTDAIEDAEPGADLAACESFWRQELADCRRNWPNESARWQSSLCRLVALLQHEGRFSEAAGVYQDVLRPSGPPNLLVNGSFEFGNFTDSAGGNTMALLPGWARITGWVVTGQPGLDLEWFGSATSEGLTAAEGHRFLDLTGFHDHAPYDGVSQTIPTTAGQEYRVSFAVGSSEHWDGDVHPGVEVEVTGIKPMLWTVADVGTNRWETFAFTFTAVATNTTLKFTGSATNNILYIGLDNVVVTPASPRER
jgi:WD40 repeat protein